MDNNINSINSNIDSTKAKDKQKVFTDVKVVLNDAEDFLKAAASSSGEKAVELREKALVNLRRAKEALQDTQAAVMEKSKACARATDDYVHENPWKAVGVAAAVGFVFGLIVNRR